MIDRRKLREEIAFAKHCERKFGKAHPEAIRSRAKADFAYHLLCTTAPDAGVDHVEHVTVWRRQ